MPAQVIDLGNLAAGQGFIINGNRGGDAVSNAGDVNGDGIDDLIIGAPSTSFTGPNAVGGAYVIFGKVGATRSPLDLGSLAAADGFYIQGAAELDRMGRSVSNAGDVNGDGIDDLVFGAPGSAFSSNGPGAAYVVYGALGATRGTVALNGLAAADGFAIRGDAMGDYAGFSVSGAGDVNGDGIEDLVVGASRGDDGGTSAGEAYVVYGKAGAARSLVALTSLSAADGFIIQGDLAGDAAGGSVSGAGDINGDGIDDLIVGAVGTDGGGSFSGAAYVVYGKAGATRGTLDLTGLAAADGFIIQGDAAADYAGRSVSSAGDVNGDGIDDLIVGAPYHDGGGDGAGAAFVIYGKAGATRGTLDLTTLTATDGYRIQGDTAYDSVGFSVSGAGDVNGDGIADLIVGASGTEGGGAASGGAYVILGKAGSTRGTVDLSTLDSLNGFILQGGAAYDRAGSSVSAAGDVNGDGIDDLIVSATDANNYAGRAYVIFGSRLFGAINGTAVGETLTGTAGADTINGLGGNDVLDGGAGADTMRGGADNDIYVVDDAGDVVEELSGEGTDSVETVLAAYTLPANVENLEYTGAGAFTGTGNGEANIIVGGASGDTLNGLDGDDTLGGEAGDDILEGGNGNDRLNGGTGADTMNGGAGNDVITIDNAGDTANGGDGSDTLQFVTAGLTYSIAADIETISNASGGALTITLNGLGNVYGGSAGRDIVDARDGADTIYGRGGSDALFGGAGIDRLFGDDGSDSLSGEDGNDLLYGGSGMDSINGGNQNDKLYGMDGDDDLSGGAGIDELTGGAGADIFRFDTGDSGTTIATADRIIDFSQTQGDRIDISDIFSDAGLRRTFYILASPFSGRAGEYRIEHSGNNTYLQGDVNGDGLADFVIRIDGEHVFMASDFIGF